MPILIENVGGQSSPIFNDPIEVRTLGVTDVNTTSVELEGELASFFPSSFTDSSADVSFYWVEKGTGPVSTNTLSAGTLSAEGEFSANLTGLSPDTTYEFQAIAEIDGTTYTAKNPDGSEEILEFTTDSILAVTTNAASDLTFAEATLNGSLDDLGDAADVDLFFEWGPQTGSVTDNSTTKVTVTSTGSFSEDIDGLDPNTAYDFQIVAEASDGDSVTGSTLNFTTNDFVLATNSTNVLGVDSIEVEGEVTTNPGGTQVSPVIEYREQGATDWLSQSAGTIAGTGTFTETIDGLIDNTTYEFRARVDYAGTTITGSTLTATTDTAIAVSSDPESDVGIGTATFNGTLDTLDSSQTEADIEFVYGPTSGDTTEFTATASGSPLQATGSFSADITGLDENTQYEYVARGTSTPSNDEDESAPVTFTTGELAVATSNVTVNGTDADLEGNVTTYSGTTLSFDQFFEYREAGTSAWTETTASSSTSTGTYTQTVSDLDADTDYEFRAVVEMNGNRRNGGIVNFTTESIEITTNAETDLNVGSATLNGTLEAFDTDETDVDVNFSWGPAGNVAQNTVDAVPSSLGATGSFEFELTGLDANTQYEFRAEGTSNPSGDADQGQVLDFTTDDIVVATTATPTNTTTDSLTIEGDVTTFTGDGDIEVGVEYVDTTTGNIGTNGTDVISGDSPVTGTGTFTTQITGLSSSTSYDFRAFAEVDGVRVTGSTESASTA